MGPCHAIQTVPLRLGRHRPHQEDFCHVMGLGLGGLLAPRVLTAGAWPGLHGAGHIDRFDRYQHPVMPVVATWLARPTPSGLSARAVGLRPGGSLEGGREEVRECCSSWSCTGWTVASNCCPWDYHELAQQLIAEGIVGDISASTVRRMLAAHQLTPWRYHLWLSPRPRDAAFYATIADLMDLDTRPLRADERGLSMDENTSLQPWPRLSPTLPARPHHRPTDVEPEDTRAGALNLLAAFDTRSGMVYGPCSDRKRQRECWAFLEAVDGEVDEPIRTIHLVGDHVSMPQGQEVSIRARPASTRGGAVHPRTVHLDASSRTMVPYHPTQTLTYGGFCLQRPASGQTGPVHSV